MKNYVVPMLTDLNEQVEGVYAASGNYIEPTPTLPLAASKSIYCEYCGHNSGSHSEVKITMDHIGVDCEGISMTFSMGGLELDTVKDSSGNVVSNLSENGFTIYRNGHLNGTDKTAFLIQITIKHGPQHGAVGTTGEYMPCGIVCTSYHTA